MGLVRAYMDTLLNHFMVTDLTRALGSPHALAAYVMYKMGHDPDGRPVDRLLWSATSASDNVSTLPTALRFIRLPYPPNGGVDTQRLAKGVVRVMPEVGVASRPAIPIADIVRTQRALMADRTEDSRLASALLELMVATMLRAGEWARITPTTQVRMTPTTVLFNIHDKTHLKTWRQLLLADTAIPGGRFGTAHAFATVRQLVGRNALHRLFREQVVRILRGTLRRTTGYTMGCLRPTGVMYHMRIGTNVSVMKKIGGWSAQSNVWMEHYFDVEAITGE